MEFAELGRPVAVTDRLRLLAELGIAYSSEAVLDFLGPRVSVVGTERDVVTAQERLDYTMEYQGAQLAAQIASNQAPKEERA